MGASTRYVTFDIAVMIIEAEKIGPIRDLGLLQSAIERPSTTVMGEDAYPDVPHKAAALLHSICLNHALVDGNKLLAAILALVFLEINGFTSALENDGLFDVVMACANGDVREVGEIASALKVVGLQIG